MKTKLIVTAGLLCLLALFTIAYINPAYSQGDPKCANCTKAACDESCKDKGVCSENDKGNCSEDMSKSQTTPGTPSGSGSVTAKDDKACDIGCTNEACVKSGACKLMGCETSSKNMKSPDTK
jgi:hypothetical protein